LNWIHRVAGGDQRLHPRATVGLDPDQHLIRLISLAQVIGDQGVQRSQPSDPFRQPPTSQHGALSVHQLHVVMGLSPIVPKKQHVRVSSPDGGFTNP